MVILVTGGAGYIGSACVVELIEKGEKVVVIDNMSKGVERLIHPDATFYELDTNDNLDNVFLENNITAVIHFASYKAVEESMENATKYSDNITGLLNILKYMVKFNVNRIIFSSSAAVYGEPNVEVITEDVKTKPINFYGWTKLCCEQNLRWFNKIHDIKYISMRYFNVAGDYGINYIDPHALNVIPILMECVFQDRARFTILGEDYDTPDGTCVRDYIDIKDLVRAHILALDVDYCGPLNLGTNKGVSVRELVDITKEVTGENFEVATYIRRKGDPAILVASNTKAKEILRWEPKHDIVSMIKSTYEVYQLVRSKDEE